MKKLLTLILAIAMVLSLTACGDKKEDAEPTESGSEAVDTDESEDDTEEEGLKYDKVIIGVDDTFAPMGFRDDNNELTGFDIELAQAVFDKLGIKVEFQVINWAMKEEELNQGNIDMIWNGYTITDQRKEKVAFSHAYLDNKQVIVVLAESGIKTFDDLEGKVVATQEDSASIEALDDNPEFRDSLGEIVTFSTFDEAILDLEAGRSDAVVADSVLLDYIIAHKDDPSAYVILDQDLGSEEFGIGFRKDDTALLEAVEEAYDELMEDGTIPALSEKWFGDKDVAK